MEQFFKIIKEGLQEGVIKKYNENFGEGYDEAGNLCIDIIEKNIDRLCNNINSGKNLSEKEQFLLSELRRIKKETDDALRAFFYDDNELRKS